MKKIVLLLSAFLLVHFAAYCQPINFVWAKDLGGKGANSSVGIAKDATGNLYITGEFVGTRDFGTFTLTSVGSADIFVAKYTPTGTCLWATRGGYAFSQAYGGKIAVSGNDVFVTGSFLNLLEFVGGLGVSSTGNKDIFVAGFDATTGTCTFVEKAGSAANDVGLGIEAAAGGGFFLCGSYSGTATFGSQTITCSSGGDSDLFYAKYAATGICSWVYGLGNTLMDAATSIKELPSGDILLTGSYQGSVQFGAGTTLTSVGFSDLFLAKFNSNGQFTWATSGGCIKSNDGGQGISFDPLGNIYVAGFIGDTATFGNVVIINSGGINVLVAKFNSTGNCLWAKTGGNIVDDIAYDIATDFGGSSYVTGYLNGNCFFGSTPVNGVNYVDIFIAKYDFTGLLRWITRVGGSDIDKGRSILLNANGFCYVAGEFADVAVFGSTGLTAPTGVTGIFLTRMGGGTVGINEIESTPISIYPNPSSDYIQLDLQKITDAAFTLSLFSLDGKQAQMQTLTQTDAVAGYKLDLKNMASGTYLLKLETSKGDFSNTVVIQ